MPDPATASEETASQQSHEPDLKLTSEVEPKPDPDCSKYPPKGDCDTGVDSLTCNAKGDDAKAEYNKTFVTKLETAKTQYESTRAAYRVERDKARVIVEDVRNQIRHLIERIGCQIEQKRVRKCLDDAFCDVLGELKCCKSDDGCCVDDCDFPLDDIAELSAEELSARIVAYQARTDRAETCFNKLINEPTELAARVEAAKKSVADINTALGGDAATLDLKKVYADALVAQWKIRNVWGGFPQRQDFVTCLCDALKCWTEGCKAVYALTGAKAVKTCQDEAKQARCELLRTKTSEQILAGYDRHCAKSNCEEPSEDDGHGGGEPEHDERGVDDDDDCDCHNHHHHCHGRHHHRDCGCDQDDKPRERDCGCN